MEIDVEVEEISTPLKWRTRYAASTNEHGVAGFKASRTNKVIPISSCPVLIPEIDFSTLPSEKFESNQRVEVAISSDGRRSVAISRQREGRTAQRSQPQLIEGDQELFYEVNQREYRVSQSSFWQSNINAPAALVDAVLDFASLQSGDHILDLYGGVGLFAGAALDLIGPGGRIDIVEGSSSATRDAVFNFKDTPNVFTHTGDVARAIKKFKRADVIILDPPRTGAGREVIEKISTLAALHLGNAAVKFGNGLIVFF